MPRNFILAAAEAARAIASAIGPYFEIQQPPRHHRCARRPTQQPWRLQQPGSDPAGACLGPANPMGCRRVSEPSGRSLTFPLFRGWRVWRRARAVYASGCDLAWRRPQLAEVVARIMMLLLCPHFGILSGTRAIRRFVPAWTGRELEDHRDITNPRGDLSWGRTGLTHSIVGAS